MIEQEVPDYAAAEHEFKGSWDVLGLAGVLDEQLPRHSVQAEKNIDQRQHDYCLHRGTTPAGVTVV